MPEDGDCCRSVEVAVASFAGGLGSEQAGVASGIVERVAEVASMVVCAHGISGAESGPAQRISQHCRQSVLLGVADRE